MDHICENLGEDINSEFCQEIRDHLEQCPECCASVDAMKKTVHLYKNFINEEVPQKVDRRLWQVLQLSKPKQSSL